MKKIILPIFLMAFIGASAQKVSGKLLFQTGQKIEITSNMNSTMTMMMGESSNSSVSIEVYDVKEANASSATLEQSVKNIKLNLSIMGQEKSMDSDNPEDLKGMVGEPIKDLLKAKSEFTIDAYGKIIGVKGEDKKKNEGNGMMGMFMQQMNMSGAVPKVGNASLFKILPDYEVGKGDSWMDSLNSAGTSTTINYTIKNITDSEILVDFVSDGKIDTKQEMMGMSMDVKGTIKSTGTVTLNKTTGIMKQRTVITTSESSSNFNGQDINTTSKMTAVITVKIKQPA